MFARTARQGLAPTGILLIAAAAVCAAAGGVHMLVLSQAYGQICGPTPSGLGPCAACSTSLLLFAAGLAALAVARAQPIAQSTINPRQPATS